MMKGITKFFLLLFIGLYACSSDNQEEFYSTKECDTSDVTFAKTIDPIMERNCKVCHFNGNGTGVTLVTYDDIKASADNGGLLGSIKHLDGFSPMPQGGKLDDCTIAKIEAWIDSGALDN